MRTIKLILLSFLLYLSFWNNSDAQWIKVSNGIGDRGIQSLEASGSIIYAGSSFGYGVLLTSNNGDNWIQTSLTYGSVYSLTSNGKNVFAGTSVPGLYFSSNSGANWTLQLSDLILSLRIIGNKVFAGAGYAHGIYVTMNNGTNWTQTSLNNRYVWSIMAQGNNIFAGCLVNYGVYVSTNNGITWSQTSLNNQSIYSLAVNASSIFAGTDNNNGVYKSTNNGNNWVQTSLNNSTINSIVATGNNIFATFYNNFYRGVMVSNDNGINWNQRSEGLPYSAVLSLCISNNYIFASTQDSGVYRRPLNELIGIHPISNEIPSQFQLFQNYPNPFNPSTKIKFALPKSSFTKLVVYDILGREVQTIVNEQLTAGTYEAEWDAHNYPSGVYYYKLTAGDPSLRSGHGFSETRKMVLVK